jgi:hypothetical protein
MPIVTRIVVLALTVLVWHAQPSDAQSSESPPPTDKGRSPEQIAAFCMGGSEAWLSFMIGIIRSTSAKYPKFSTLPYEQSAARALVSIKKMTQYLSDRGAFSDQRQLSAIFEARQQGLEQSQRCLRDEAAYYIPCQTKCEKESSSRAADADCVDKTCKLPASCKADTATVCLDFQKSLGP